MKNCIRFQFNAYYPNREAVIEQVTYLAETYLGRFDWRGYANCVLVGQNRGGKTAWTRWLRVWQNSGH